MDDAIIFFDIDGVATTTRFQAENGAGAINPYVARDVADLARDLGARIVVSSTWRSETDLPDRLEAAGIPRSLLATPWRTALPASGFDSLTGDMRPAPRLSRAEEIAAHIVEHGISRYLILDDDHVMPEHVAFHVKPDTSRGLSAPHFEVARILASRWPRI